MEAARVWGAPSIRFPALHLGHLALRGDEGVSQLNRKGIKTKMISLRKHFQLTDPLLLIIKPRLSCMPCGWFKNLSGFRAPHLFESTATSST